MVMVLEIKDCGTEIATVRLKGKIIESCMFERKVRREKKEL